MNDAYCRDISIKIRSHLEVKRRNGEYIGAFTPYGYKKDENDRSRLVPDLYAAGVVKDIFRMKLHGMSQTAIADCLNEQGILSPMEYNTALASVSRIILKHMSRQNGVPCPSAGCLRTRYMSGH